MGCGQADQTDREMMALALAQARVSLESGGVPVGAVLAAGGQVVAAGHNERVQRGDPVAHGEIACLRNAGRRPSYADTTLYTTLSPCQMCTGAILLFQIPRVVVGEAETFAGDLGILAGDQLCIGALARHADLLESAVAGELFPIFHDAERVVADPIVRLWGTVGGSLCQADPSEDLSAVFAAARAIAVIRGLHGDRVVPVREFHLGPYETVIGPGELLAEVRVPVAPGTGSAYEKVARRVGDWSVAAAGAVLRLGGGLGGDPPVIVSAGLGLTAVGAEHFVAAEAEEFLRGRAADSESFTAAGAIAAEHCHPVADQRGPEDYKRHLVAELSTRALRRAAARV